MGVLSEKDGYSNHNKYCVCVCVCVCAPVSTHAHMFVFWFTGTLHRRNGFYTVQTVCAIALHQPYT